MKSLLPWFVLILIFFFSLTIISCGDDKEEYSDDNTTTTTDTTAPDIAEVTKVTTPTNDTTPDYTFSSTEAGTISYGGSCSSSTTISISGNNTITLDSLSDGTYSDCIIVVRGSTGYLSNTLTITTFIVDTTAPTVSSVSTTADNQSSVAITDNITVTFYEAMDTTTITTNTSNSTCSGTMRVSSDNFSNCVQMDSSPASSNSDKTFTLDPSDNLTVGTTYKTRVTTGVKDAAGNAMSSQYDNSTGFTTANASRTCTKFNDNQQITENYYTNKWPIAGTSEDQCRSTCLDDPFCPQADWYSNGSCYVYTTKTMGGAGISNGCSGGCTPGQVYFKCD